MNIIPSHDSTFHTAREPRGQSCVGCVEFAHAIYTWLEKGEFRIFVSHLYFFRSLDSNFKNHTEILPSWPYNNDLQVVNVSSFWLNGIYSKLLYNLDALNNWVLGLNDKLTLYHIARADRDTVKFKFWWIDWNKGKCLLELFSFSQKTCLNWLCKQIFMYSYVNKHLK